MSVFEGTLLLISQTDTLLGLIAIANLSPSAENARTGAWRIGDLFETLAIGIDMREMKEKFLLFVPPDSD